MQITVHGQLMRLVGLPLKVGDRARNVRVSYASLSLVPILERSKDKACLFLTVPSLDIPIFSEIVKQFHQRLKGMEHTAAFLISADLPFAQARWQQTEQVSNITFFSDYRDMDFARNWGLLIQEWGLLAQAVYVVDRDSFVTHREIVLNLTSQPDFKAAMIALEALA